MAPTLVVVDALFHHADQRRRDAGLFQVGQSLLAHLAQIGAAQVFQRLAPQRIELQINLEARL
jgi:hypothetical protein